MKNKYTVMLQQLLQYYVFDIIKLCRLQKLDDKIVTLNNDTFRKALLQIPHINFDKEILKIKDLCTKNSVDLVQIYYMCIKEYDPSLERTRSEKDTAFDSFLNLCLLNAARIFFEFPELVNNYEGILAIRDSILESIILKSPMNKIIELDVEKTNKEKNDENRKIKKLLLKEQKIELIKQKMQQKMQLKIQQNKKQEVIKEDFQNDFYVPHIKQPYDIHQKYDHDSSVAITKNIPVNQNYDDILLQTKMEKSDNDQHYYDPSVVFLGDSKTEDVSPKKLQNTESFDKLLKPKVVTETNSNSDYKKKNNIPNIHILKSDLSEKNSIMNSPLSQHKVIRINIDKK